MWYIFTGHCFNRLSGDFLSVGGDFLSVGGDFLLADGDFLLAVGDFLLVDGDFLLVSGGNPPHGFSFMTNQKSSTCLSTFLIFLNNRKMYHNWPQFNTIKTAFIGLT